MLARFGREEGYTEHRKFGHKWNWILKFCSLVNCYSSVKAEHWIFRTVTYSWMGGIRRIGKLKINGIVSQSVIYVSGSTQGSEF